MITGKFPGLPRPTLVLVHPNLRFAVASTGTHHIYDRYSPAETTCGLSTAPMSPASEEKRRCALETEACARCVNCIDMDVWGHIGRGYLIGREDEPS